MSTIAVISDVHGNLEALQAVLARIDELGVKDIYSLGDVVGYGSDPEACILLTESRCRLRLMGNHEYGVLHATNPGFKFNATAQQAIDWTRQRIEKAGLLDRISGLQSSYLEGDLLFVHGSARNALNEYILEADGSGFSNFDKILASLEQDFTGFRICFVGHNHKPFLATTEGFLHPHPGLHEFQVPQEEKLYVSVGSVGQPRDRDPRACFVTFDGSKVTYHRVTYPFATTAEKIHTRGLPVALANRLALGK
ncbi:MAG: metallophosphoesterase family protein [Rhodocyclaceae bacterium]|nr:metallophosphoesterase family protein [Rhodocyclaceae bacterium]